MRIGLTYDVQTDPGDERQAEFDSPHTIAAVASALRSLGHDIRLLGDAEQLIASRSMLDGIDLVFNIAEGAWGRCREAWVPMLLEQWGVLYVGSDATAQALGLDKVMSKRLARASDVPTPAWAVVSAADALASIELLRFPLIVKPRYEGSGLGIDPGAVVHDPESLRRRVAWALQRFSQPCVVEEFIAHGELTVFLIGNHPPQALPAIQRPLDPDSRLSCHVTRRRASTTWLCPLELTQELDRRARAIAAAMFDALGCRDMARVDLRVDEAGRVYFLEINPLPSFDPEGSVGLLADYFQVAYRDVISEILHAAMRRLGFADVPSHARLRI